MLQFCVIFVAAMIGSIIGSILDNRYRFVGRFLNAVQGWDKRQREVASRVRW